MISSSTISWISSTPAALFNSWHFAVTAWTILAIWAFVRCSSSFTVRLALSTALWIFSASKQTSLPLLFMMFIALHSISCIIHGL